MYRTVALVEAAPLNTDIEQIGTAGFSEPDRLARRGPAESLEVGVQIGDFRIEQRLGAGGMGIVYRARQVSLNRVVALKVLGSALDRPSDIIRLGGCG